MGITRALHLHGMHMSGGGEDDAPERIELRGSGGTGRRVLVPLASRALGIAIIAGMIGGESAILVKANADGKSFEPWPDEGEAKRQAAEAPTQRIQIASSNGRSQASITAELPMSAADAARVAAAIEKRHRRAEKAAAIEARARGEP